MTTHRGLRWAAPILAGIGLMTCVTPGASFPLEWKQVAPGVWRAEVAEFERRDYSY